MKLYILKYNMIYHICKCDIKICLNDHEAYEYYKNTKFIKLYNKKYIADTQNLNNGSNNIIIPDKFPVIVRPIINLNGMGKDAHYIYDKKNFYIPKDFFWCEVLKGIHISIDIFYSKNKIQGYIAFKGVPDKLFTFLYWEYLEHYIIADNILLWIKKYMKDYCGVFNLEIINNKIIECHLRMGDLNYFQNKKLIYKVIKCYKNKKIKLPLLPKIYLIPIFLNKGKYIRLKNKDIYNFVNFTNSQKYILNFLIDPYPENCSNPMGGDRICNFTVTNLNEGFKLKTVIKIYAFFIILLNFFSK